MGWDLRDGEKRVDESGSSQKEKISLWVARAVAGRIERLQRHDLKLMRHSDEQSRNWILGRIFPFVAGVYLTQKREKRYEPNYGPNKQAKPRLGDNCSFHSASPFSLGIRGFLHFFYAHPNPGLLTVNNFPDVVPVILAEVRGEIPLKFWVVTAMALNQQLIYLPSSPLFVVSRKCWPLIPLLSKHYIFLISSNSSRIYPFLFATPPSPASPIFLPYLHKEQESEDDLPELDDDEDEPSKFQGDYEDDDPIHRFFESQTSNWSQDPPLETRFSLQVNRRSSWRLSSFDAAEDDDTEVDYALTDSEFHTGSPIMEPRTYPPNGVVGEILQIAWDLPENSTLGEFLGDFSGRISSRQCLQVLSFLEQESLLTHALYFFEWMGLQEPSLVTPRACSVIFPMLGKAGMGEELITFVRHLPNTKQFRDVHVYNVAISGLMSCGRYTEAWDVYETMEGNNVQPDHVTCSIIITLMRKNGKSARDVWEFFERMNRKGVNWSVEVMGALIKSFCDEGLKKEALIIQTEMEKKGIPSNVIIYNTLMNAYSKLNQMEEAEGLFSEMKVKGLKPSVASYNILMDAYSRRMQPEIVEKLLSEMHLMGLKPNVTSYTCLISAYGRKKDMSEKAAGILLKMRKANIKPNCHSYTSLIHAYSVSGWHQKAYAAFENMQREGIKPSVETYTTLLDAYRRAGDTEVLMRIWKMMIREKVGGTRVTFNILLDGFSKQGQYMEARDVISEFQKLGLGPTVMTYNMLMNAYARGGQHSKLPQLLEEMANLNLKPDSVTYSTMIYAYVRVRDFRRAFFYHKNMVKSRQLPDVKSYEKLRAILDVKAAIKNKKDKSAILGIINSKMGSVKQKKRRKKNEFWKDRIR
ncbi:hypothetical protein SAY87_003020 [Trapa incisa]|uniref:Pentatricopeptide repeat-containing protein n=1 Tax=Trapa incisa TaxID=236973 RepID=A0AAN7KMN1_9MYRT|nr:hypothetical protein SAY87_003020 [Trapa incisa]